MSRIIKGLTKKGEQPGRGFIPFLTAGDPSLEASLELAVALGETCSNVLELGVPFSDPVADGPVIQRSSLRALKQGATLRKILGMVRKLREQSQVPVVLFSYFNPVLQYGLDRLAEDAREAGVDGLLLTDLTPEESAPYLPPLWNRGLDTIFLASPTTTPARMRRIAEVSRGFVYLISRAGVTGEQEKLADDVQTQIRELRRVSRLPIAVGFGISHPDHVRKVWSMADAAVVGSALVRKVEEWGDSPQWIEKLIDYAQWLTGRG